MPLGVEEELSILPQFELKLLNLMQMKDDD